MVSSKARTVDDYLADLPPDRREAIATVRRVVKKNLPRGFEEGMQYGMIGWYVPLSRYPNTYNGQPMGIAALASQKGYMSLYLVGIYAIPKMARWFKEAFAKTGKKLDMGKSCVRFKKLDDLPLDVIGEAIANVPVDELVAYCESAHPPRKPAAKKRPPKKAAPKRRARA